MCHLILLLPFVSLPVFWLWPLPIATTVYILVLVISVWVYYYVLAAMRRRIEIGPEMLADSRGEVVATDAYGLRVRVNSEVWSARSRDDLVPGDEIEVVRLDGLRLHVRKPLPESADGVVKTDCTRKS